MTDNTNSIEQIKMAQGGDKTALDELVSGNIALVKSIALKFLNRGTEYEDLIQIGSIGLIRAIQRFDSSYDVKFSTYAVPVIMGEIKRFLRDDGIMKVSRSIKENAVKIARAAQCLSNKYGREPTLEELSKETGIALEDIVVAIDASTGLVSLDEVIYEDNKAITVMDCLEDKSAASEQIVERIMLKQMLSRLCGRDRQIIVLRYFQDKTQTEVAKSLNISQVQVSRLENKILKQLRERIS